MDPSRIQKLARAGSAGSDKARIIFLVVLSAVVVAAFFYFQNLSLRQAQELDTDLEDYLDAPPPIREVYAKVDPARLEDVRDATPAERVVREKDAYLYLIKESAKLIPGDMEILGVQNIPPADLRADPASFRGRPVEIKGALEWFEREEFQDFKLFRGYLVTPEGDYVYFTVMNMPDEIEIGGVMKLQGFFFKIFSCSLADGSTRAGNAVYLVGNRLKPSFYHMDPVTELDPEILDSLYVYTFEDSLKEFRDKPLFHFLSYVRNMDPQRKASLEYQELLPAEIRNRPMDYRGKPVKVLGYVKWSQIRSLGPEGENPLGVPSIIHALAYNYRGGWCYFLTFDLPDWIRSNDMVYVKGIFYRNYTYTSRRGDPVSAPVLIACEYEPFVPPEDRATPMLMWFFGVFAILLVGFFFLSVFRDRKEARRFRARFIERKKRQLSAVMTSGGGTDSGGAPGGDAAPETAPSPPSGPEGSSGPAPGSG